MTWIKNGAVKTIIFKKMKHESVTIRSLFENRVNFHNDFNRLMLIIISVNTVTPKCHVFRHLIHTCMNVIALQNNIQPSDISKQMMSFS